MKKIIRVSTVPGSINTFLRGFLRKASEDYEVVAISSPGAELDEVNKRERVRTIAVHMQRQISLLSDLCSLIKLICVFLKEKPDIVHSITPKAGLLSMTAAWITRVPVRIHTFTGLIFPTSVGVKKKLLMFTDRITCACATYINPESKGVKKDLSQNRITKKPLHIIANGNVRGVDMEWYKETEEVRNAAEKLMNPDFDFTFCFIGRLVKDKGINELVYAFSRLVSDYPKVRLILIGGYEPDLNPLAQETIQIIDNCPQINYVGRQNDVRPWLTASDAFVFPSYREGMPNCVLEAGAMNLPCIVTDINGSNEIIHDGVNGEIIPVKDAEALYLKMREWIENREKVSNFAAVSRKMIIDRYEQSFIWNETLDVYRRLLAEYED